MMDANTLKVAVLIPCYNEATTVGTVVRDFHDALPDATVYVFDNNSSDDTATVARQAGATVRHVALQGKGNVIRRMFADVEADVYVLVDGDDTYDAKAAPRLLDVLVSKGLDMVVGARIAEEKLAYRFGHRCGNVLLTRVAAGIFGRAFKDMLSGYRLCTRRYAKSFPAHSVGFEVETELTIHALELRMPVAEVDTPYRARPPGSESKLSTYRDGLRILRTILKLFKSEKPLLFFTVGFVVCSGAAIVLALPLVKTYLATGLVPRFPTAILCAALMLYGVILFACGIVLDTVTLGRLEAKQMAYLRTHPLDREQG